MSLRSAICVVDAATVPAARPIADGALDRGQERIRLRTYMAGESGGL